MFKKKQRSATVVGLDLDPSHIAAAEVASTAASPSPRRGRPAAPGVLRDGEVADPAALAEALQASSTAMTCPRRVRLASPTSGSSCARSTCR